VNRPVAIVDYGMGNLFSVRSALVVAGVDAVITGDPAELRESAGIVLPGVGAFGDAMDHLRSTGLDEAVRAVIADGLPVMAVCLGMQLLLTESTEFGSHRGLGVIDGHVVPLRDPDALSPKLPHIGWEAIEPTAGATWDETPLDHTEPGSYFYFVHSYHCVLDDPSASVAAARYADATFCAAFQVGSVFACQFHPERSGQLGIDLYASVFGSSERGDGETDDLQRLH
jgi:glutamine amidotransferase